MITDRDIQVLMELDRYYILNRLQIQQLCFPSDKTGRVTRRRLQALVSFQLISRHRVLVHHPHIAPPGSIYYPSKKGCEFLAEHFEDERHLLTPTVPPQSHHVLHWLAVSDTHIALDAAIGRQETVLLDEWINEWNVVNKDQTDPEKRFRLYTLLRDNPRLVCAPDAAFLLTVGPYTKVFYLEQDRATTGSRQVVARKSPGYIAMAKENIHLRQFPAANVPSFTVLLVAPTDRRRDALRRDFRGHEGCELWKFASATDLTAEAFLHEPVIYSADGDPLPLVKADAISRQDAPSA